MYKNAQSLFSTLVWSSLWYAYASPNVYGCPTRWQTDKGQRKFTRLYNEMDAQEGHLLNGCCIYGEKGHNIKTCETRQRMLFFYICFKLNQLQLMFLI